MRGIETGDDNSQSPAESVPEPEGYKEMMAQARGPFGLPVQEALLPEDGSLSEGEAEFVPDKPSAEDPPVRGGLRCAGRGGGRRILSA
ncbi:hypothetical protein GCM10027176_05250 [Actinoallomurus bryophytorum]